MKNLFLLSLTVMALCLGACGPKAQDKTYKATRGTGGNQSLPNIGTNASSNPGNWALITPYSSQSIIDFLSSGMASADIGQTMNCSTGNNQPCETIFNVAVNPDNQQYGPLTVNLASGSQSQFVATPGVGILTVAVYDSRTGVNGNSAIGAPAQLLSGQMTYSGNSGTATLVFNNNAGTVTMQGSITGQTYTGTISFQYNDDINTNAPVSGTLGQFNTSICYIFQCNQ